MKDQELKQHQDQFKKELSNLLEQYGATIMATRFADVIIEFTETKLSNGQIQPFNKLNLGEYFN